MVFKSAVLLLIILLGIVFAFRSLKTSNSVTELLKKQAKLLTYFYLTSISFLGVFSLATSKPGFYQSFNDLTTAFALSMGFGGLLSTLIFTGKRIFTIFANYLIRKNENEAYFLKLNIVQKEMVFDLLYIFLAITEQPEKIIAFFIKMLRHQNPEIKEIASKKLEKIRQLEKQALQNTPELKNEAIDNLESLEDKTKITQLALLILKEHRNKKENDSKNDTEDCESDK